MSTPEKNRVPVLDLAECSGCEACLELCPSVFTKSEAGFIEMADLEQYPEKCIDEVIACCPRACIGWQGETA